MSTQPFDSLSPRAEGHFLLGRQPRVAITETSLPVTPPSRGNATHEPLPPSVETAYWRKCIQLKRRINEIEENNDIMRLRKIRINRAILKMRLERAFLLEQLEKRMEYNADGSDRSTSPPPTPQDKPLRSKRAHRKNTPPPLADTSMGSQVSPSQSATIPQNQQLPPLQQIPLISPTQSTPDPSRSSLFFSNHAMSTPQQPAPGMNGTPVALQPYPQHPRQGLTEPMPPLQPQQYYDGYEDRRPVHALPENGTPAEYGRSYAPGVAGSETIGASLGGAAGANGERRPDAEMAETSPLGQQRPGSAGGFGGFTAVNRNI